MLDMLVAVLGQPGPVFAAQIWTAVDEFTVLETGEHLPRDAPDNVMTHLELGGIPVTLQLSQTSTRASTTIDILGASGSIRITAPDQPQMSPLDVTVTDHGGTPAMLPTPATGQGLARRHPGHNVATAYARIVEVVSGHTDSSAVPGFDGAVSMHRLVEEIERQAVTLPTRTHWIAPTS